MNRQEAEQAQTVLREADHTGRLDDLEIVELYTPETAHVQSPVYTIPARTKDGHARHISDYHEALAFAATATREVIEPTGAVGAGHPEGTRVPAPAHCLCAAL